MSVVGEELTPLGSQVASPWSHDLMATVHDVAQYILKQRGPMTAMKLQKLVYYSQAWHLVWDEEPLFQELIEAWANGPVVPALYAQHRGQYQVAELSEGDAAQLSESEQETIDAVLGYYGDKSSQWLSDLTHRERPWKRTREEAGVRPGERCDRVIPISRIAEYYGSL